MQLNDVFKYLSSGVFVYAVMAACSRDGGSGGGASRSGDIDGSVSSRADARAIGANGGAGTTVGGSSSSSVEGGLLDRFVTPIDAAFAQDCATCASGALRVMTAETDMSQWTSGTFQLPAVTAPGPLGGSRNVTTLVATGPLFVTTAAGDGYYIVKSNESCALDPSAASDDSETDIPIGGDPGGDHFRAVGSLSGNSPSAKVLVMADEKLCVIATATATDLPARTSYWQGFRPYTG